MMLCQRRTSFGPRPSLQWRSCHRPSSALVVKVSVSSRSPRTGGSASTERLELETLARQILTKENEIKNAFQPGRPMPKGAVVAAMRNEVKELRDFLAKKLNASSESSDNISTNKEISSLITAVAAAQARESMNSMHAQMKATNPSLVLDDGTLLDEQEILELEMLQLENEQLRAKASALLMRQHFLEELMRDNGLTVPPPAEVTNASSLRTGHGYRNGNSTSDNDRKNGNGGYYMSSPSYY